MPSFPENPTELFEFLKSTKCTVIKFSASWCGPCKNVKFLKNYGNLKKEYEKDVIFWEFDVDENTNLIEETKLYNFNISAVPTIKIFHYSKQLNEYKGASYLTNVKTDIETIINNL